MEFVWLQILINFIFLIPEPHVWIHMAGTVDVAARVWVYWALAKKMSGKLIKMNVLLGFEPFLLSSSEAKWRVAVPMPQV